MLFVNRNANLNSLFVFKSIDVEDETKIQARFLEFVSNKTVIIIAHRMCTEVNIDRIVVLANGLVV